MAVAGTVAVRVVPGVCGTCKYWGEEHDRTGWRKLVSLKPKENETEQQRARREHAIETHERTCQKVVHPSWWDDSGSHEAVPVVAYVTDASGYYAGLVTTARFGCVLWEPADER